MTEVNVRVLWKYKYSCMQYDKSPDSKHCLCTWWKLVSRAVRRRRSTKSKKSASCHALYSYDDWPNFPSFPPFPTYTVARQRWTTILLFHILMRVPSVDRCCCLKFQERMQESSSAFSFFFSFLVRLRQKLQQIRHLNLRFLILPK